MINIKNKTKKGVKIKYRKYLVYLVVLILLIPFIKADLAGATPEAYSFMKAPGPSVNLFTGDMSLGIPVMVVPGRGMNFPISLSYAAGIRIGQEASWVGLGWNFFPGSITRNVNGIPDDYKAGGTWDFNYGTVMVGEGEAYYAREELCDEQCIKACDNEDYKYYEHSDCETYCYEECLDGTLPAITGNIVKGMTEVTGAFMDAKEILDAINSCESMECAVNTYILAKIYEEQTKAAWFGTQSQPSESDFGQYDVSIPAGQMNQVISGMDFAGGEEGFCSTKFSANGLMYFESNPQTYGDDCSGSLDKKYIDRMNPDSWSISGPVSGNMMFVNDDSKFHLKSFSGKYDSGRDDQIKIEYETINGETTDNGLIKSFTITAKDGTKYIYDHPVYNVNQNGYSSLEDPDMYLMSRDAWQTVLGEYDFKRRGATTNTEYFDYVSKAQSKGITNTIFQRYFFRKFAYTWLLTKILAPNYVDVTGDGPTADDKGNWIKFNYDLVYGKRDGIGEKPFEYRTPFSAKDEDKIFGSFSSPEYSMHGTGSQSANTGYMEIAYLNSIVTPTHTAEFITSDRNDGAEYYPSDNYNPVIGQYKSGRTSKKLDEIQLKRNNNLVSKVKFNYDYSLNKGIPNNIDSGVDNGRLTLKKIQQFDGGTSENEKSLPITEFKYNLNNPSWDTGCYLQHTSNEFRELTDPHYDDFGYYWQYGCRNNHKILDNKNYMYNSGAGKYNNDATAWSLASVKWPSGSETSFEYETKKYSQLGDTLTKPTHVGESEYEGAGLTYGNNVEHYGGGIRLKSVTQSGNSKFYTTKYEYEDGIKSYGDLKGGVNRPIKSSFNPRFVGYGKVTESVSSNDYPYGRIEHYFTTRNDYPPIEMKVGTFLKDTYDLNYEDRSALIGLGKKTIVYDDIGNIISTTENEFENNVQIVWEKTCSETQCKVFSNHGRAERIKFYWIKPTKTINTLDGVKKTTEYKFNNVNGLPFETTESGDNVKTRKTITSYAFNEYPEMLNNHILTKPFITELKEGGFLSKLISKSKTEYYDYPYYVRSTSVLDNIKNKDLTTTFDRYDEYGNLLETTDPKTYKTYFEYSPVYDSAYLTKGKNALGHEMLTDYDPEFGVVTSITDFNKQTTHYGYDTFGRLTIVTKDGKILNQYEYDDLSFDWRKTKTRIDVLKEINLIEYFDDFARLDKTELKVDDNTNIITKTEYNNFLIDKIDKVYKPDYSISTLFTSTEYEKSPLARIKKIVLPGIDSGEIKTDYSNQESMYKTSVTDEELRIKSSLIDIFGNLRKIIEPGNLQTTYTYDIQNNLLTITDSRDRLMTDNKYNSLGQLIESWQADTGTTKFTYDDNGNMITRNQQPKTDDEKITTYSYDELNRLIKITYPTSTNVVNTYDTGCINGAYQKGKLCQLSDSSGTMQFQYDNWGRVVKEIKNVNGINEEYIIEYKYNDINDITEIKLSKGITELNKINYEYNNLNQLVKVKVSNQEISYTYNPTSTIKDISFGTAETITKTTKYTYTDRDWLKTLTTSNILEDTLNYDKVGNIKQINEKRTEKSGDVFSFDDTVKSASYAYDNLDRLTDVQGNYYPESITYIYDFVGNRLTRKEGDVTATYNYYPEKNQMKEDGNCNYEYDVNGNTKTKTCGGEVTTYNYDDENRLISVVVPDKKENTYVYDANGLRTIKKDSTGTTIYIYDMNGNNIYEETI